MAGRAVEEQAAAFFLVALAGIGHERNNHVGDHHSGAEGMPALFNPSGPACRQHNGSLFACEAHTRHSGGGITFDFEMLSGRTSA